MPFSIRKWFDRYTGSHAALPALDVLVSGASPSQTLEERLNWLIDVAQWIRHPGPHEETSAQQMSLQSGRMRRLLDVLDRNPAWKLGVARTLRSIISETRAVALFSETGLPRQFGLLTEMVSRLTGKIIPHPPGSAELGIVFDRLFPYAGDDEWIEGLDGATVERFGALLAYGLSAEEKNWNRLAEEMEDALTYLSAQVRVVGGAGAIRQRLKSQRARELPFFKLGVALAAAFAAREKGDEAEVPVQLNRVRATLEGCHASLAEAWEHLEKRGVSTEVVYHLAFLEKSLQRFEDLLELAFDPSIQMGRYASFVALLVRQNRARESVVDLIRQNFRLLTRKMVERTGETGEHYIAHTRQQYSGMLRSAAGGGALMAVTAWLKTILLSWGLPGLMQGLAASVNYSIGFVAIQLTGSSLATKQPANTAAALAARMHQVREEAKIEQLVDEIVCLFRSQVASIVGNLALVVPMMLLLHYLVLTVSGHEIMPPPKAAASMHALSILGPSLFYAAFTGVLLWTSSLAAGWAGNWMACNYIGEALATDRRLIRLLGPSRAGRFSRFLVRNFAGLTGNISFGFMLGIIPEVAEFAGIPLDVRHVTLSAGFLTAAAATLGWKGMASTGFLLAVFGVLGIGFMNLVVSFSLAMFVATRACNIQGPERRVVYRRVMRRAWQHPISFLLPPIDKAEATAPVVVH